MRRKVLILLLCLGIPRAALAQDDQCTCKNITMLNAVPLLKTKNMPNESYMYEYWACDAQFEKLKKAIHSGFDPVLFGPLFVPGGKWSASNFEERKKQFCPNIRNLFSESSFQEALLAYDAQLSHGYLECSKGCRPSTLNCWVTADKERARFSVMYTPPPGSQLEGKVKVNQVTSLESGLIASERPLYRVLDRKRLFPKNYVLQTGPNEVVLDRLEHPRAFTLTVHTTRGPCSVNVPSSDEIR